MFCDAKHSKFVQYLCGCPKDSRMEITMDYMNLVWAAVMFAVLGGAIGLLLASASKAFAVPVDEKAEKIIADAREKAAKEEADMQRQIVSENQKLIKIRRDIHNIRRNAIKTLSNLEAEGDETEE